MPQQDENTVQAESLKISELPRTKAAGYAEVYTNTANILSGFFDVSLIFGVIEVDLSPEARKVSIQDRVSVRMSWEHAKALADLIHSKIDDYQKLNGPLRAKPEAPTIEG
jgi:hypothetical protein